MASTAGKPEDTNAQEEDLHTNRCSCGGNLEALQARISEIKEQICLCDAIMNDLLEIQNIVAEKGLENASYPGPDN